MDAERPPVLVLDGEQRAALAVVRSLGQRGCAVHVASAQHRSIAGGSRYATSESLLPDPLASGEAFSSAVGELVRSRKPELVLPITEAATLALLEHPGPLGGIELPTSDLATFQRACDKSLVLDLGKRLGIAVPAQYTVSGKTMGQLPAEIYPVVIKPARSVAGPTGHRRKVGVGYARTAGELEAVLRHLGPDVGPFLIQQRVVGPGLGVFLLRWGGEILASFAHRRIREKPPSGGVSVCCESVELPTRLRAQSVQLLEGLGWNGVAMIEYKRDLRTGQDFLMEVNPRFWGSLQLAIDAGVDFPWRLVQAALGSPASTNPTWTTGLRSRWCWGDLDHLIARLRRSPEELHLPPDAPGLLATMIQILRPWQRNQRNDVFRLSDPRPALREAQHWLGALRHSGSA